MNKLIMLGVGSGGVEKLYNTCFVIQNQIGNLLIDTGGSIDIIRRLREININYKDLKHIFISHSHTDHILGLFWLLKKTGMAIIKKQITTKINIYCNDDVYESIISISQHILPESLVKALQEMVNFIVLEDGDKHIINDVEYTFFNIKARGFKQFGFECNIDDNRLIFLGDETLNSELNSRINNSDFVLHEAYCLDSDKDKFYPNEKNHSTVKSASIVMNELNVKNLILYHTEESHGLNRKKDYLEEGRKYFKGNLYVPDEFEEIKIKEYEL